MKSFNNAEEVLLTESFRISHRKDRNHKMDRPHFHDGYEIHFTLCNQTQYYINEKKFLGNQGTVAVIESNEIHRVVVQSGVEYERYYILFKPKFLEFALGNYPDLLMIYNRRPKNFVNCLQLDLQDQITILGLLNQLIAIYHENESLLHEIKLRQKFIELLIFLTERYIENQHMTLAINYTNDKLLTSVTQYIKANVGEDLSLKLISERFYTSKSTLIRLFKIHMGMTPFEFITYSRIIKGRELILQGYSVHETTYRVGYRDDSSFIKKFKQLQGMSPKQYVLNNKY